MRGINTMLAFEEDPDYKGFEDIMVKGKYPEGAFDPSKYFNRNGYFIYHHKEPDRLPCIIPRKFIEAERVRTSRSGKGREKKYAIILWKPSYLDFVKPNLGV